jgi:GNAT superfamily N-acetyltransferase
MEAAVEVIGTDRIELIRDSFGEVGVRHAHFAPDLALGIIDGGALIAFSSAYSRPLPNPFGDLRELYVDFVEVRPTHRRLGLASLLLRQTIDHYSRGDFHQIRSWSSEDKAAMLPLWRKLGFALCPAHIHPNGRKVFGYYATFKR